MKPARQFGEALAGGGSISFWAFAAAALGLLAFALGPLLGFRHIESRRDATSTRIAIEPIDSAAIHHGEMPQAKLENRRHGDVLDAAPTQGEFPGVSITSVQLARELAVQRRRAYHDLQSRIDCLLSEFRTLQADPKLVGHNSLVDEQQLRRAALTLKTMDAELNAVRATFQQLQRETKSDLAALTAALEGDVSCCETRLQTATIDKLRRAAVRENLRAAISAEIGPLQECLAVQQQLTLKKLSLASGEQRKLEVRISRSIGQSPQRVSRRLQRSLDRK